MTEVRFTFNTIEELADFLRRVTRGPSMVPMPAPVSSEEMAAEQGTENPAPGDRAPLYIETQEDAAPSVTVQDLQTLGRKLAATGHGAQVQEILRKHNAKLLSRIPADERADAYAEMQEVLQHAAD